MFEHFSSRSGRAVATATAAAALAACGACTREQPTMVRCYDTPQQKPPQKAGHPKPLTLHYNTKKGTFKERPAVPKAIMQHLLDADVLISIGGYHSSGFLTTGKQGRQIVVGPAHLAVLGKPDDFTFETRSGDTASAASGCYLYEQNGKFADPQLAQTNDVIPPDVDVAVFRPKHTLKGTSLTVAAQGARRGTWLMLVNSQLDYTPEQPAVYSAISTLQNASSMGNVAISGLDTNKFDEGGRQAYTLQPGGSGSLMADMHTGAITDMAVTSSLMPIDEQEAWGLYRLRFTAPVATDSHIEPVVIGMVDAPTITTAVNSEAY